jgi:hypothetical protein
VSGDKGAQEDTAHLNSTQVVDVAEIGGDDDTGNDCLYETKCISPLKKSHALGLGSVANGGAPAPMGHIAQRATRSATPPSTCAVLFTDAPNVVSSIKDHSATTKKKTCAF